MTVAFSICPSGAGSAPKAPAETWAFCAWMAPTTSAGASSKAASLAGSSQTRMAYFEPKTWTSPTPWMRLNSSTRFDVM